MNIVGYRSPFKKASPLKNAALAQIGMAAAPGIIGAIGSLFGSRRRRREQKAAAAELQRRREAFESIQYVNPYENLTNPYAGLQNPYAENLYEDLGVNMQAADFLREQQQQSQANLMQQYRGVAGGSGVAGLAQAMSNISSKQARQASLDIARQERANELARIKGEQQKRIGQFGVDKMKAGAKGKLDMLQSKGEAIRRMQENRRTENLFGLSLDRKMAADQARQTARAQFYGGIGYAAAGVAGLYAPGGMRAGKFGTDLFDLSDGRFGTNPSYGMRPTVVNPYQGGVNANLPDEGGIPGLPDYLETEINTNNIDPNINPITGLPYPEFKEQPMGILETQYPFKY